jgi:phthalate 4,5-dioxygenase oxygenase subunit
MLSAAENELLTRTDRGTAAGDYLRRFWLPALLSEEIPAPDCAPVRVTLMGERLVAFRDSDGKVGLIDRYCAHRQMDLFFGRNEDCGLRCVYHGWKFDVSGECVEMPTEPPASNYKERIRLTSYPCQEHAGIIWAYMGPKDLPVEFPQFEFNTLPKDCFFIRKSLLECNYLQAMEGNLDSFHTGYLHSFSTGSALDPRGQGHGKRGAVTHQYQQAQPHFEIEETDYGLMIGAKRKAAGGGAYWRITQWLLPVHTMIAANPGETLLWDAWVPMDDEHTWVYRIDYLIDRGLQRSYSYTGIKGTNAQDAAAIENQGPTPIADRTKEHLGNTDVAIMRMRRKFLAELKAFQKGSEPVPALKGDLYKVRAIAVSLEDDGTPFYEGAKEHLYVR